MSILPQRMNRPGTFVLLFLVATVVSLVARRVRVPYTVALVVAGLGLGATHVLAAPALTRDVMFGLVLPALLFEAAFDLELEEVRHDGVTMASLAVPGVVASILITLFALPPLLTAVGVPATAIPTLWSKRRPRRLANSIHARISVRPIDRTRTASLERNAPLDQRDLHGVVHDET